MVRPFRGLELPKIVLPGKWEYLLDGFDAEGMNKKVFPISRED